jgi:tRNA-Thr(GGU) m(6)t(6)A37 methyltransferase TsaA
MAEGGGYSLVPIGWVRSDLKDPEQAPRQGSEGAPKARIEIAAPFREGLAGIVPGQEVLVVTWLHLARRDVPAVHPRRDPLRPLTGVFNTRSPDRPNPLALHRVTVLEVKADGLEVEPLEAVDGTPVVDIKPVLSGCQDA